MSILHFELKPLSFGDLRAFCPREGDRVLDGMGLDLGVDFMSKRGGGPTTRHIIMEQLNLPLWVTSVMQPPHNRGHFRAVPDYFCSSKYRNFFSLR